jgi:hypothetical protein
VVGRVTDRQVGVKNDQAAVRASSEAATKRRGLRSDCLHEPAIGAARFQTRRRSVYDIVFVLLTVVLFAALALLVRGVERL